MADSGASSFSGQSGPPLTILKQSLPAFSRSPVVVEVASSHMTGQDTTIVKTTACQKMNRQQMIAARR